MTLAPPPHGLPPAYDGCTCSCHRVPGIMHFAPCCRPSKLNMPTDPEWYRKRAELEGDSVISAGVPDKPVANMVLVPVNAVDQLERYEQFVDGWGDEVLGLKQHPKGDYVKFEDVRAMLSAAPQPSLEGEVGKAMKALDGLAGHFEAACHVGDAYMIEENAADAANLRSAMALLQSLSADNARLREERDAAQRALEHDRTKVIDLVNAVSDEFERRSWLITSRGSYEWDDERFQEEFGAAIDALTPHVQAMRKIGSDWSNCPMTGAEVTAARVDLEARLSEAVEVLKPFANAVFNDNGDLTVNMAVDSESLTKAYFAYRRARQFLDTQGGGNG